MLRFDHMNKLPITVDQWIGCVKSGPDVPVFFDVSSGTATMPPMDYHDREQKHHAGTLRDAHQQFVAREKTIFRFSLSDLDHPFDTE